eukprot:13180968-Alexandrium_andersonii.AAC.1
MTRSASPVVRLSTQACRSAERRSRSSSSRATRSSRTSRSFALSRRGLAIALEEPKWPCRRQWGL